MSAGKGRGLPLWVMPTVACVQVVLVLWSFAKVLGFLSAGGIAVVAAASVVSVTGASIASRVVGGRETVETARLCARRIAPVCEAVALLLAMLYLLTTVGEVAVLASAGAGAGAWAVCILNSALRLAYATCVHAGAVSWMLLHASMLFGDAAGERSRGFGAPVVGVARYLKETR